MPPIARIFPRTRLQFTMFPRCALLHQLAMREEKNLVPCSATVIMLTVHRFRACGGNSGRRPIAGDLHGGLIIYWLRLRCGADPNADFVTTWSGGHGRLAGTDRTSGSLAPLSGLLPLSASSIQSSDTPTGFLHPSLACRPSSKRTTFDDTPTGDRSDANRSNLSASSHLPLRTFAPSWAPPGRDVVRQRDRSHPVPAVRGCLRPPRTPKQTLHILGSRTTARTSPAA